jgi:hypothetical protein
MSFFLANLPRILMGMAALVLVGYMGFEHWHLAYDEAWIRHYEAVQKRNGEAISAQNRAIRLMWTRQKASEEKARRAGLAADKILTKAVRASQVPVKFASHAGCDQDVAEIFWKVRGLK